VPLILRRICASREVALDLNAKPILEPLRLPPPAKSLNCLNIFAYLNCIAYITQLRCILITSL
jgi:hypothetical protein